MPPVRGGQKEKRAGRVETRKNHETHPVPVSLAETPDDVLEDEFIGVARVPSCYDRG